MICILHGYLLDGSGSNLWTRSIVQSLCRQGKTVHLVCQERHPEQFDFIAEAHRFTEDGAIETLFKRDVGYAGRCIMHKPWIGDTLPVYVWDKYEEFPNVVPMIELPDEAIEAYLERNTCAVAQVARDYGVSVMHANHAVLMSVVAQRVGAALNIPYAIMPHGSAIEYAVKKDERFLRYGVGAFTSARRVYVIGKEMRQRVNQVFASVPDVDAKMKELNLGVDTGLFEPIERASRSSNIKRMLDLLSGVARGKRPEMSEAMLKELSGGLSEQELAATTGSASHYSTKLPDADIESKLNAVDWAADDLILFVGRIISSKGLQSIVAALPLILGERPNARLIAVGHGPLREPLEALLWALENGERGLVKKIVECGRALEGSRREPLAEVAAFYERLDRAGRLDDYFEKAQAIRLSERVIFTGYLTHRELCYLFPCCDVAIFPSVVAEAGPLVFLEALASGCFPLGTYFAGMAASIDSVATALPAHDAELMKLSPAEDQTVADIAAKTPRALLIGGRHKGALRETAVQRFDWKSVASKFAADLNSLA